MFVVILTIILVDVIWAMISYDGNQVLVWRKGKKKKRTFNILVICREELKRESKASV